MNTQIIILACIGIAMLAMYIVTSGSNKSLNGIKSRTVGDGQHGSARWATNKERSQCLRLIPYEPAKWRQGLSLPDIDGTIVGYCGRKGHVRAFIDTSDSHTLLISTTGGGKTTFILYPNVEFALASGRSFLMTDSKGDGFRDYAGIAEKYYGYKSYVIDLRNPTRSHGYNMLYLCNKYMDSYKATGKLSDKSRAERYAKIAAKSIVRAQGFDGGGQNSFFYDSAEGLIAAVILLVSEFCKDGQRHIVSVFKLVQELLEPIPQPPVKGKPPKKRTYFQQLMESLPPEHKAKWLAGAALNTAEQSMESVMSTAMSRLLSFIDSELEQVLCFDSAIDAEQFCDGKTAVFIVMPEEDATKHFLVSLFVTQLYNNALDIANQRGNRLDKRLYFYLDEYGTLPKFDNAESMFSAGRSRNIIQMPMIQSDSQLYKNYGKDGADIIKENCQNVLFGGLSPLSKTAEELSRSLGNRTVATGSISMGGNQNKASQNLQMVQRPLMTPDEIKKMKKTRWILEKTGNSPMQMTMKRYDKWGIKLDCPYSISEQSARAVQYADRDSLIAAVQSRYPQYANNPSTAYIGAGDIDYEHDEDDAPPPSRRKQAGELMD